MAELLTSRPGVLAAVNQVGVPGFIKLGIWGTFPIPNPLITTAAIITRIGGGFRTNTRFQHALDNSVYTYSFGDRMGQTTVSGLAFESDCGQINAGLTNPLTGGSLLSGLDQVLSFYRLNRVSIFNRPVIVFIGSLSVVRGFLIGMDFGTQDVNTKATAWTLQVATLPGASNFLGVL